MAKMSDALREALNRSVTAAPPGATAETELNNRAFIKFSGSGGYEYVNRDTVASPTQDGHTHVILFQHVPIVYLKLDAEMKLVEQWAWDTPTEILAFLDGPDYTG